MVFDPFAIGKVVGTTYKMMTTYKKAPNYETRLNFTLGSFPLFQSLATLDEAALAVPVLVITPILTFDSYTFTPVGGRGGARLDKGGSFGSFATGGEISVSGGESATLTISKPSITSKSAGALDIFTRLKDINVDRYGALKYLADNIQDLTEGAYWVQANKGNFGAVFDFYTNFGDSIIKVLNAKPIFADWEKTGLTDLLQGKLPAALTNALDTRFYLDNLKAIAAGDLRAVGLTNFQTALNNMIADGISGAQFNIDTAGFQKIITDTFKLTIPQGTDAGSFYDYLGKWFSNIPGSSTILSTITTKLGTVLPAQFTGAGGVVPWFKTMAGDFSSKDPLGFAGITKKFAAFKDKAAARAANIARYAQKIAGLPNNLEFEADVTVSVTYTQPLTGLKTTHTTKDKISGNNIVGIMKAVTDLFSTAINKESEDKGKIALSIQLFPITIKVVGAVMDKAVRDVTFYADLMGGEIKGFADDFVDLIGVDVGKGLLKDFGGLNTGFGGLGNKFTDISKGFGDLNLDWKFPKLGA